MATTKKTLAVLAAVSIAAAFAPVSAQTVSLLGPELASFSTLAGGYATYGAGAVVSGTVGAMTYVVGGAGSQSAGDFVNTGTIATALTQIATAKAALNAMQTGNTLLATMSGIVQLAPGVYGASALTTAAGSLLNLDGGGAESPIWVFNIPTYLVTGAGTQIQISNAGSGASVLWNTGGYTALGASTAFIGTILAGSYISQGVGANMVCGNTFAMSYISIPAGAGVNSSSCAASGTWAGSVRGMGMGLDIVDGVAVAAAVVAVLPELPPLPTVLPNAAISPVPEPETYALLLAGLAVVLFLMRRTKRRDQA